MKHLLLLLFGLILFGCKPTEKIVYRDNYINKTQYDSIYIGKTDSIYIHSKNDTVFVEKYLTLYKNVFKLQKDTVLKTDSIIESKPPIIKEIEIPLTWLQKFLMTLGKIFIVCFIASLLFIMGKVYLRING